MLYNNAFPHEDIIKMSVNELSEVFRDASRLLLEPLGNNITNFHHQFISEPTPLLEHVHQVYINRASSIILKHFGYFWYLYLHTKDTMPSKFQQAECQCKSTEPCLNELKQAYTEKAKALNNSCSKNSDGLSQISDEMHKKDFQDPMGKTNHEDKKIQTDQLQMAKNSNQNEVLPKKELENTNKKPIGFGRRHFEFWPRYSRCSLTSYCIY